MVACLSWHDGPLLEEYRNEAGEPYLGSWVDIDDTAERWVILRCLEADFLAFNETRQKDLRTILQNPVDGFVYIVDKSGDHGEMWAVNLVSDLNTTPYMPAAGAYLPGR